MNQANEMFLIIPLFLSQNCKSQILQRFKPLPDYQSDVFENYTHSFK